MQTAYSINSSIFLLEGGSEVPEVALLNEKPLGRKQIN
jgi:hypothetical protein